MAVHFAVRPPALVAVSLLVLLLGALLACTAQPEHSGSNKVLSGSVSYREKIQLPSDIRITVSLQDVALQDVAAVTIAETRFGADTGPPYPFELSYDPAKIHARGRYSLRATITLQDRLLFSGDQHIPAFTGGPVDMLVKRVPAPRPRPQYQH